MSISEKDAILREREAFKQGVITWQRTTEMDPSWPGITAAANRAYPLPKVTRPRVVTDRYGVSWKIDDGELRNLCDGEWTGSVRTLDGGILAPTLDRVKLWADLLERPDEEVEA